MSIFSSISSAITTLTNAGLSSTAAASAVHSLFGGVENTVKPLLATILGNYANADVVKDCITKISETSGLPAACVPLVNELAPAAATAASNPAVGLPELNSIISAIETELAS